MSSLNVRTAIKAFIAAELPSETLVDITAEFEELQDFLDAEGVAMDAPWLEIQFASFGEEPVDILSSNTKGKYRETGTIFLHIVDVAKKDVHDDILVRAEAIRDKFRGQRIGSILIESVSPANFGSGVSLSFEGGYMAGVITADYEYDRVIG